MNGVESNPSKNISDKPFEFVYIKKIFHISESIQILIVTLLFLTTTYSYKIAIRVTSKMDGYDPNVSMLFVPIYEEVLFRGIVLKYFEKKYGFWKAVIFSSTLFSIWHFKNMLWLDWSNVYSQMIYTGLLFGPVVAWITLKTRSLWPAVIIHYLNNMPYEYLMQGLV